MSQTVIFDQKTFFYYLVLKERSSFQSHMSGNDGEEATPVPIPNTEVKLFSADGSWGLPPVRVGRCQAINTNGSTFW